MSSIFRQFSHYYRPFDSEQQQHQIVDISDWTLGGDFDPYAEGTRSKYSLRCPEGVSYPFLIPRHRYMYKKTFRRRTCIIYDQFWVEIAAYKIGRRLGVEVPPAFVACKKHRGLEDYEYASLIEWYYDYPDSPPVVVDRGGNFMSLLIEGYDRDKGTQHNFVTISELFYEKLHLKNWANKWAKMLLFDAIIGNTDRHQENWEVVSHFGDAGNLFTNLSPAFDNGTAMGYEVTSNKISEVTKNLFIYIKRGRHHLRWHINDAKQSKHFDLIELLLLNYPQTKDVLIQLLLQDIDSACEDIFNLTRFEIRNPLYRLTDERAALMISLLSERFKVARQILGI